jgi:hypothetical protein
MPTPTYDLLASNVLSSNASSVTFSSIPATYRDLVLVVTAKITVGTGGASMRFNADSGSNYNMVTMEGTGSATQSGSGSGYNALYVNLNNGELYTGPTVSIIQIMDYSATNKHKSTLHRANGLSSTSVGATAGRWASTSAINSIEYRGSGAVGSGGAASIEFTNIAQTGKDLLIVLSSRVALASSARSLYLKFNGSSTSDYSSKYLRGSGSTASSGNNASATEMFIAEINAGNNTANTFTSTQIYLANYSVSQNNSVSVDSVMENNDTFAMSYLTAGVRANTAAITSLELFSSGTTFVQYTTASLYIIS